MQQARTAAIVIGLCAALAGEARADDTGLVLSGTLVKPMGGEGRITESTGVGGEILLLPSDAVLVQIGGFGALGRSADGKEARDIYDLHLMVGLATSRRSTIAPYACLGIDVLSLTSRDRDKGETLRGTTLGVSAQAGLLGRFGDRGLVKASASYLGAIVPGTGDDLAGLVLQLAIGAAFD